MTLPSELKREIASVERDINYAVYGGTLENPDEVLLKRGGGKGLKLYEEIEEDPHAYAVLQKRKLAVIARPWEVKAASEKRLDKKAADLVKVQLEKKLDKLTMELLDATLKGFSVVELMWQDSGSEIFVDEFKARDQRRFTFTPKNELRLLTRQNMVSGEAVPERKFIRHSFGAKDGNPFGRGLGSKLYFPVWFKRQGISFWLVFCEKFGSPTAVGKYGQNASEADQKKLLNALRALAQDAGVIVPEDMAIELLEATRSSTSDLYERLIRYIDEQVSEAVLGETLTTNIGSVGSKAAADTHDGVRLEVSKADADLLSQTLNNTLCKWITELNVPGANPPTIWRVFEEEEDLNTRSQRDKILFDMGFKLTMDAVKEIYGDHYEVVDQGGAGDGQVSNEDFLRNSGVDPASQGQDTQQQAPQDNAPGFAEDEDFLRSSGFVFLSEEIPGFAELLAVFSESNKVAIKDANSLLELKAIIETVYQDGISAIPEVYLDGDNFVGIFEDRVSEQLVKRFNFTLSELGIDYKLINPGDVSNFGEVEFANAPVKKKNCVKGVSCGSSCISPTKSCRKGGDAIPGDRVAALKQKVGGGAASVEQPKPEVKKAAPEPVKETPKPVEQPKPEAKKAVPEPIKETPKPVEQPKPEVKKAASQSDLEDLSNISKDPDADYRLLGAGGYGKVYLDESTNPPRAIKYSDELSSSEIKMLKKMSELGIAPEVYGGLKRIDKFNQAFAMEFVKGETLSSKFKKDEPQKPDDSEDEDMFDMDIDKLLAGSSVEVTVPKDTFISLLQLRKKMHENGIAHQDMHAGNIMVTDKGDVKVIDTGLSVQNKPDILLNDLLDGGFLVSTSDEALSKKYYDALKEVRSYVDDTFILDMNMKEARKIVNNFYKKVLSDD